MNQLEQAILKARNAVVGAKTGETVVRGEASASTGVVTAIADTSLIPCPTCGKPMALQKLYCPKHDRVRDNGECEFCVEEASRPPIEPSPEV